MTTTIKNEKLDYFEKRIFDWWDPTGSYRSLHMFIPLRMQFIIENLEEQQIIKNDNPPNSKLLEGLNVLDVGCGVGLISERLASMGANVTGIDPSPAIIDSANKHLMTSSAHLTPNLRYLASTAEEHVVENSGRYDVVIVFLVLEHIQNRKLFLDACIKLLKPGGSLLIQNVNKNWITSFWISYYHAYITKFFPKNIIQHSQIISTQTIIRYLTQLECKPVRIGGIEVSPTGKSVKMRAFNPTFNLIYAIKD